MNRETKLKSIKSKQIKRKSKPKKTCRIPPLATSSSSDDDDDDDEEEDDDDESSSSESCSSSSSYNSDSSSSSDSASSDDDSDMDDNDDTASASCTTVTRSKDSQTNLDPSASWGFAAEAKKNFDIFRRPTNALSERVFGNFDGVDKESLVKTSSHASNQNTRLSAQQAQSRMLMPMFSNSKQNNSTASDTKLTNSSRRKTKTQSSHHKDHKDHKDHRDHQPKDAQRPGKKTEFSSFLKTKNNRKLNAFAVCDSSDTMDTKDLFTRPKTTKNQTQTASSSISFGSNRGNNSCASHTKVRLNHNNHNSKISKQTHQTSASEPTSMRSMHSKDTARAVGHAAAAPINNNSNSIRNNNTNCNNASNSNKLSGTPRRVALVSLPLDPNKNRTIYGSSSEDEIPYLTTPSTSHQSDNKYSLDFASLIAGVDPTTGHTNTDLHRHGVRSIPDSLGMSSNYPMLSSLSPHTPPYNNKNQSMGKNNHIHH